MNEIMVKNFYEDDKMFHILICDDELSICTRIEQIFSDYSEREKIEISTETFLTGEELLKYMMQNSDIDLIFLDIELPGDNGALIGKMLRENLKNESVQIVFISSYDKYAMQLFQVRPFDFLIKPLNEKMIIHIFEKYRRLYGSNQKFFEYKVGKHTEKVLLSEVMYFVCEKRRICIVTSKKNVYFYGNMKELHKTLEVENFWSVHNSFIINIRYVKRFKDNEIIMCDDSVIPVSYAYKKAVKRKIIQLDEGLG